MIKVKLYLATAFTSALIMFYACRHEIPERNAVSVTPPPTTNPCNPDSIYFVNEIMPIISSNCTMSGCHDQASHQDGVVLTTYTNILRYVNPGNASDSKLYTMINRTDNDRMPPPPQTPIPQDQKNKIYKWINQGALYNYCMGNCDTAVFAYSSVIKSTIQNKCVGCHNPSSLGGSIDLSTYTSTRTVALNGKLNGSITQQPGYSAMPKNSAKLSDCEIQQFQKWINAGAPNN
jgi:uncharacterized membrane protein